MTPFLTVPDPHDRPARLREAAAARRLARQARTRSPQRASRFGTVVPGNDVT
jgi:hypothetical protein